jgi:dihydrofolate synthase/folylpolyglutamate synthase
MMTHKKESYYEETVTYLYQLRNSGTKFGLENIQELLKLLGNPDTHYRSIHIAGTNGKGSTATMIASILKESGLKVGLFLSPHLSSFTERISVNSTTITEEEVVELATFVKDLIAQNMPSLNPTFFEFVTALAFYYFSLHHVDYGVFETGMGGRLDATNILKPLVSVITNISMDHMEYLGKTLEAIAFEKAGIIKPGTDLVTGVTGEGLQLIEKTAQSQNATMHLYGKDFSAFADNQKNGFFRYEGYTTYEELYVPLHGRHQIDNAALSVRVCEILEHKGLLAGTAHIQTGLREFKMLGRVEIISHDPLIVLDGAHNPEAVKAVIATVQSFFSDKNVIVVAGIMEDKDIPGTFSPLLQIARLFILTRPEGQRAAYPETIAKRLNLNPSDRVKLTHSVAEALKMALNMQNRNDLILVTGSFYVAGEARTILKGNGILAGLRE